MEVVSSNPNQATSFLFFHQNDYFRAVQHFWANLVHFRTYIIFIRRHYLNFLSLTHFVGNIGLNSSFLTIFDGKICSFFNEDRMRFQCTYRWDLPVFRPVNSLNWLEKIDRTEKWKTTLLCSALSFSFKKLKMKKNWFMFLKKFRIPWNELETTQMIKMDKVWKKISPKY